MKVIIVLILILLFNGACSGLNINTEGEQENEPTHTEEDHKKVSNTLEQYEIPQELLSLLESQDLRSSDLIDVLSNKITEYSPTHFKEFNNDTFHDIIEFLQIAILDYQHKKENEEELSLQELFERYYPKLKDLHREATDRFSEKFKELENEINRNEFWEGEANSFSNLPRTKIKNSVSDLFE